MPVFNVGVFISTSFLPVRSRTPPKDASPMTEDVKPQNAQASGIWGGRFNAGPSAVMQAINASVDVDKRLFEQDIAGSLAHARMLAACGVISSEDEQAITAGLIAIRDDIIAGEFEWKP